jgi:hypothetical protein
MKNIPPGMLVVALATSLALLSASLRAQDNGGPPSPTPTPSPTPPSTIPSTALSATVDYGNGNLFTPTKQGVDFSCLGFDPGQSVTITVAFPTEFAGQAILAEPLDGGILTLPDGGLIVGVDGTVSFQFQVTDSPGEGRLAVHQADDMNLLHFWVIDPNNPDSIPPGTPGIY